MPADQAMTEARSRAEPAPSDRVSTWFASTRTSGSAIVTAKPSANATPTINQSERYFGSSPPMKRPIGNIPSSMPMNKSTMPAIARRPPARN